MPSIQEKVDANRAYAWVQIENWLKTYYGKPIKVEVFSDKMLYKEYKFAKTVFSPNMPPKIYIDYNLLKKGNKKEILYAACREAVRIGLLANGIKVTEIAPEFRSELKRHGLPDYGGLPETGYSFYTYSCIKCGKVYALKKFKIQESAGIVYNPKVLTSCCEYMIKEDGRVFYTNEELQKYSHLLGKHPTTNLNATE